MHPTLRRLDALAVTLRADPTVVAVLGFGSAGEETARFDEHSDIDVVLVVEDPAVQHRYTGDLAWLGGFGVEPVFDFAIDASGRKALLAGGLLVEYAVFTPEELAGFPVRRGPGGGEPPRVRPAHARHHGRAGTAGRGRRGGRGAHRPVHRAAPGAARRAAGRDAVHPGRCAGPGAGAGADRPADPAGPPGPLRAEPASRGEARVSDRNPPLAEMAPGYGRSAEAAAAILAWLRTRYRPAPVMAAAAERLVAEVAARG